MTEIPNLPSRKRILVATTVAAGVAATLLIVAILPAEYGIDPLGTGRVLGLTALAQATEAAPDQAPATASGVVPDINVSAQPATYSVDEYKVELRPFEGVEYKYRLEQGESIVYSWTSTAPVHYEFHGEPDGAPPKYFDSYKKGEGAAEHGGFIAAKAGIHGWFWENKGATRITVTLRSAGFYSASTEYRDGERHRRTFPAK